MDFQKAKDEISRGLLGKELLVIIGSCEVDYFGRATSKLKLGKRLVLIKGDGSVSIHQNRLVRPTNYMLSTKIGCDLGESCLLIKAQRQKPLEFLRINFFSIDELVRHSIELSDDLRLSGSERDLNEALMQDLSIIEDGLKPINQQQHFRKGICDIVAQDSKGSFVVIELKRRTADFDAVTQLHRYVQEVNKIKGVKTRGILLAPDIRKRALELLYHFGLEFAKLDFELTSEGKEKAKIKGLQKKQRKITSF
ncbi:MAG: endonuclease NucS [Candidatus Diapherotrites archaeon]